MNDRDRILSSIRKGISLGKDPGMVPLRGDPKRGGAVLEGKGVEREKADQPSSLAKLFQNECELLSAKVYGAKSLDKGRRVFSAILKERRAKKTIRWDSPIVDRLEIDQILESLGVQDVTGAGKDHLADVGVSGADYALADTGTLVLRALPGQDRSTSLLPPVHVAFLDRERILPGLDDLIARIRLDVKERGRPDSCITLISGPSKTADIEMTLVHGIHGPKEVHVIILEEHF